MATHYHPMAGRCLPSTNFALLGSIGLIGDQKVTLLRCIARGDEHASTEEALMGRIAVQAARVLGDGETAITVADRKFNALELLESGHQYLVLRRARNMTFRRAAFTANTGRGRPVKHGEIIRPLVSKQLLGAHRLFMHNAEMCYRVPELVFVAGAILTYLAGVIGATPTGWWDTKPRASAGRLRRVLARVRDYHVLDGAVQLRFKRSVTGHLPVGQAARRAKPPQS